MKAKQIKPSHVSKYTCVEALFLAGEPMYDFEPLPYYSLGVQHIPPPEYDPPDVAFPQTMTYEPRRCETDAIERISDRMLCERPRRSWWPLAVCIGGMLWCAGLAVLLWVFD